MIDTISRLAVRPSGAQSHLFLIRSTIPYEDPVYSRTSRQYHPMSCVIFTSSPSVEHIDPCPSVDMPCTDHSCHANLHFAVEKFFAFRIMVLNFSSSYRFSKQFLSFPLLIKVWWLPSNTHKLYLSPCFPISLDPFAFIGTHESGCSSLYLQSVHSHVLLVEFVVTWPRVPNMVDKLPW